MRKSLCMEIVEWCVLALLAIFVLSVCAMRSEITSPSHPVDSALVQGFED